MADGYPIEQDTVRQIVRFRGEILKWKDTPRVMLPNPDRQPPSAGQVFRQPDLAATLRKLVEAEKNPPTTASTAATSRRNSWPPSVPRVASSPRPISRTGR